MTLAEQIGKKVASKNKKIQKEAKTEISIGAGFISLVYAGIFVGLFCFGLLLQGFEVISSAFGFAVLLTILFLGLASVISFKIVEPLRELPPSDDAEVRRMLGGTPTALDFHPLRRSPGFIGFFLPDNILTGVGCYRNLLSQDAGVHQEAADLLEQCVRGKRLKRIENLASAVVLRRLGLVRVDARDRGKYLGVTDKGKSMVGSVRG